MRPIRLEMIAFGPYSNKEIIGFDQLEGQHLFLITGPTGAGKTTVFDAICYALYGESSGKDRPVKSLRCDKASHDLLTEVRLTFDLRGKIYEVHRIPSQMKKKVRGEGFTEQKAEATFIEEGKEYPIIGKDNVTEAIRSLIGLEVEQFRQIMMIPQGDFRKLLMAKSDERTDILKRIFQTTLYGVLQNKFREEKKILETQIESSLSQRLKECHRIEIDRSDETNSYLIDLLDTELLQVNEIVEGTKAYIKKEIAYKKQLEKDYLKIKKAHQTLIEEKTSAIFNNEKINTFEKNQKILEALNVRIKEIDELRKQLNQVEQAQKVYPYEQSFYKRREEKNHLEKEIETLKCSLKKARELFNQAKETYEEVKSEPYMSQLKNKQNQELKLKAYVEQVTTAEEIEEKLKDLRIELEKNRRYQDQLISQLKELKLIEAIYEDKNQETLALNTHIKWLESLENINYLFVKIDKMTSDLSKLEHKKGLQEKKLIEEKEAYLLTKKIWHMNQAALIARDLKSGDPCPVCGSTDHLHLASLPENYVTEDAVQEAENIFNKGKKLYYEIESQIKSLSALIEQLRDQAEKEKSVSVKEGLLKADGDLVVAINFQNGQIDALNKKLIYLDKQLGSLNYVEKEEASLNQDKEKLEEALKKAENQFTALELSIKENESIKNTLLMGIPKNIKGMKDLNNQIKDIEVELKKMAENKEQVEKNYRQHSDQSIKLGSKYQHAKESLVGINNLLQKEEKTFKKALEEAGFHDIAIYKNYKEQFDKKESLHEKIINFDKQYHSVAEIVAKEKEVVKGLDYKEIELFNKKLSDIEKEDQILQQKINLIEGRVKHNQRQIGIVVKISEDICGVEEEYQVVGHLSDIVNGQNSKKITFERFILATYLSDVIEVANQRLHPMTNNRYTLKISRSVVDKRSSSGLDLEVFDSYTGKERSVKTLSGGESFKASLAMALALAEVVQAYAGGIQLDTIFIDEGFGTLDQESLDSAINCLVALQDSGRLVGIISHVEELKERIKSQLIVEMDNQGSYTRFQLG